VVTAGHKVLIICSFYPEEGNTAVPLSPNTETGEGPQIVRVPSIPAFITKEDRIPNTANGTGCLSRWKILILTLSTSIPK